MLLLSSLLHPIKFFHKWFCVIIFTTSISFCCNHSFYLYIFFLCYIECYHSFCCKFDASSEDTRHCFLIHKNLYLRVTWMWQSLSFSHMAYWPGHRNGKWGIAPLWYPQENSLVEKAQIQARSMHLGTALLLSVRDSERSRYSYYRHKSRF